MQEKHLSVLNYTRHEVLCIFLKKKNWYLAKGKSRRSEAIFVDSEYRIKSSHYVFAFVTKSISDLFNFIITLLDGKDNTITFPSNKTNVPVIGFKIQIVK